MRTAVLGDRRVLEFRAMGFKVLCLGLGFRGHGAVWGLRGLVGGFGFEGYRVRADSSQVAFAVPLLVFSPWLSDCFCYPRNPTLNPKP